MLLSFEREAFELYHIMELLDGRGVKSMFDDCKRYVRTDTPEMGAVVFYDRLCPSVEGLIKKGHCGICLGDGKIFHTLGVIRIDDYLDIEKIVTMTGEHMQYLRWVPICGGSILSKGSSGGSEEKSSDQNADRG